MKLIREILIALRKAIIVILTIICLILLINFIYGYMNKADLNNITDRKYKRENSQYLVTSISKDDYYYLDFYQDKEGVVWIDTYERREGALDKGTASEYLVSSRLGRLKPEHIRIEWEKRKLENGYEYDVAHIFIEVDGKTIIESGILYMYEEVILKS